MPTPPQKHVPSNSPTWLNVEEIALSQIEVDPTLRFRENTSPATVSQYCGRMEAGDNFPPIIVWQVGDRYFLIDGHHRYLAAQKCGYSVIFCAVQKGTRPDAIKSGLSTNYAHGLRLTTADKRVVVKLALSEFPKLSDRAIAELCRVSDRNVNRIRAQSGATLSHLRIGKDGKTYKKQPRSGSAQAEPARAVLVLPEDAAGLDAYLLTFRTEVNELLHRNPSLSKQVATYLQAILFDVFQQRKQQTAPPAQEITQKL